MTESHSRCKSLPRALAAVETVERFPRAVAKRVEAEFKRVSRIQDQNYDYADFFTNVPCTGQETLFASNA